jgi:hypothetical protein
MLIYNTEEEEERAILDAVFLIQKLPDGLDIIWIN